MWLLMSANYIYSTLLTAQGRYKRLLMISLVAVLFNVSVNCLLIHQYGPVASAWIAAVTQALVLGLCVWSLGPLKYVHARSYGLLLVFMLILGSIYFLIVKYHPPQSTGMLLCTGALFYLGAFVLGYATKVIRLHDLHTLHLENKWST
jgi:O-antigen/teichoic acid export membrane protein